MSSANINAGIYQRLQAGTALTALLSGTTAIYNLQAPETATLPYVVFSLQGGGQENLTPSKMHNFAVWVRGYATTAKAASAIDAQIDALMDDTVIASTGWINFWTARETQIELVENTPTGEQVFTAGAVYRIRLGQ